jgi:hypothetical protein
MAVENERGNPANPLRITWLEGAAPKVTHDEGHDSSSAKVDTPINVCMDCILMGFKPLFPEHVPN